MRSRGLACALERLALRRSSAAVSGPLASSDQSARAFSAASGSRAGDGQDEGKIRWVFLGAPGVGKGTYASRLGKHLGVPHISMGDLVREELGKGTRLADQVRDTTAKGLLLPDELVLSLLSKRLQHGAEVGEPGFILDGFPRTTSQAASLDDVTPVDLAVNLSLREDVLLTKLLGRRMCSSCGGNFNVANIRIPAEGTAPQIIMPPLSPPEACLDKMTVRADDTEDIVRSRLEVYYKESKPVEEFYRARNQLLEFEVLGGIPETWPRLLQALDIGEESEQMECAVGQA